MDKQIIKNQRHKLVYNVIIMNRKEDTIALYPILGPIVNTVNNYIRDMGTGNGDISWKCEENKYNNIAVHMAGRRKEYFKITMYKK